MSDATKEAMDEAIAAHLADEMDGSMLSGYVILSAGQTVEDLGDIETRGRHRYMFNVNEGQSMFATVGLSRMLALKWDAEGTFPPDNEE